METVTRCRQCREAMNDGAVRCAACGTHVDPWYQRASFWVATVIAVVLLVVGVLAWSDHRTDQEQQRRTDEYVCAMTGEECD